MHTMQRLRHLYSERHSLLWVTPAITSLLAVALALAAAAVPRLFPDLRLPDVERETLSSLLTVIASSMLGVTTFSLSVMVSAFSAAANSATPRATELLMQDESTRTAISAFLSAFIFSIVAQVALGLRYYSDSGRFVLLMGVLLMLLYLIFTLIRWVRTLAQLGRLNNTVTRIETAARHSCQYYAQQPWLGAQRGAETQPQGHVVHARLIGYIRRIDLPAVQHLADLHDLDIHLRVRPGQFVCTGQALAVIQTNLEGEALQELDSDIASTLLIGSNRSFEQDPRFGLIVLSEVGQRAMSAAINDPGSGITAINAMAQVLLDMGPINYAPSPVYPRVSIVDLEEPSLIHDGFTPIARDGAANLELAIRLQKLLALVAHSPNSIIAVAAREEADQAAERHCQALAFARDLLAFQTARQAIWPDLATQQKNPGQ